MALVSKKTWRLSLGHVEGDKDQLGVVIVAIILVVVVAIVGVVIVVMIIGVVVVVMIRGFSAYAFHQERRHRLEVPEANVNLSSSAHMLRENTDSVRSNQRMRPTAPSVSSLCFQSCSNTIKNQLPYDSLSHRYNGNFLEFKTSRDRYEDNKMSDLIGGLEFIGTKPGGGVVDLTGDEDPTDEDGDTRMGDSTGVLVFLGGEISSGGKKYWESNISGSDNTGDRGKTAGRAIIAWGGRIASYACMTFIYGSLWKDEIASEAKRYLVKSFEGSGEMLPGEAGK
ncbi:hypothetical protein Tco_1484690 [Tanacetum coccineum]